MLRFLTPLFNKSSLSRPPPPATHGLPYNLVNIVVKGPILSDTLNDLSLDLLRGFINLLGSSLDLPLITEYLIQYPVLNFAGLVLRGPPSLLCHQITFLLAVLDTPSI